MKARWALPALAAAALAAAGLSLFVVNEADVVIVTRFGKPVRVADRAGLHLKLPAPLDRVNRLDRRLQTFKSRPLQLLLRDKNPIVVTCYINWRISEPLEFFQALQGAEIAEQKLGDLVNARLGSVLGEYTLAQIINVDPGEVKLPEIETRLREECNLSAGRNYGLEVLEVGIRRLLYPEIVTESVYARMRAEREKEAAKFRAEGAEESAKIKAEADRESAEITSEAYRRAEVIRGEGDAEAMRIYGGAYGQGRDFYDFWGALESYRKILGQKTTLILSSDSALFRYLLPKAADRAEPPPEK